MTVNLNIIANRLELVLTVLGGTHMELFINGKMMCDGKLIYGRKAGYIGKNMDGTKYKHISDASGE